MNKQTEALKLALEALKTFHYAMIDAGVLDRQEVLNQGFTAATAIREALAEQRPQNCGTGYCSCIECPYEQPAQEPLTDEMEKQMLRHLGPHRRSAFRDGWRSAEIAHGITKENT